MPPLFTPTSAAEIPENLTLYYINQIGTKWLQSNQLVKPVAPKEEGLISVLFFCCETTEEIKYRAAYKNYERFLACKEVAKQLSVYSPKYFDARIGWYYLLDTYVESFNSWIYRFHESYLPLRKEVGEIICNHWHRANLHSDRGIRELRSSINGYSGFNKENSAPKQVPG